MSDEKPKPVDDLKQGLNLLLRAAKGAVEKIPTDKIEGALKDGAKEVGKAFESVANEVDKVFHKGAGSSPPPEATAEHDAEAKKNAPPEHYDDAYAPEPVPGKGGPRVG